MTNLTLSRRYARALLAIGREDGNYETYGQELEQFVAALGENGELFQALTNPIYPAESRRAVLEGVLAKADATQVVKNFLLLLQDKNRMLYLDEISQVYGELTDELAGIVKASVTSATPIGDEVSDRVKGTLEELTGKQIILEVKEDSELIGGLVARVGDLVLDGSVKTQLESLKDSLKGV